MTTDRGSFGYATVLGTTDPHYAPGAYAAPLMGCPVAGQHLWAGVAAGGRRVLPIRHFMNEVAGRFLTYAGPDGEDLAFQADVTGYTGLCDIGDRDGQWGIAQPSRNPRFAFTVGADGAGRWVEHGALDLQLQIDEALPALQLATPDADEPLVYLARPFRITGGTALGAPVDDGYAFHEQVYVRSGQGWALTTHKKHLQGTWIAFVTRYADGATDWGQLCYGTRGWSFAIVIRSTGDHALVHRPEGAVTFGTDGAFTSLEVDLGRHGSWTWRPPPAGGGRMPLPGPADTTPQWSEGVVSQAGETRAIAFAHTWAETYPAHLDCVR